MKHIRTPAVLLLAVGMSLMTGCFSFQFITVDEQTALEAQVLGSFAELEHNLVLVASVRSEGTDMASMPEGQRETYRAAMNRQYNRDDITGLKNQGCLAELRDGRLGAHPCDATRKDAALDQRAVKLVKEENRDRQTIFRYIIANSAELSENDMSRMGDHFCPVYVRTGRAATTGAGQQRTYRAQSRGIFPNKKPDTQSVCRA